MQVAFDPYTSCATDASGHLGVPVDLGSDEDLQPSSLSSSGLLFKSLFFSFTNVALDSWYYSSFMPEQNRILKSRYFKNNEINVNSIPSFKVGGQCEFTMKSGINVATKLPRE